MDGNMLMSVRLPEKAAIQEALRCNEVTARYGLALTQAEAAELAQTRSEALMRSGRVEFGGEAMRALILAFCDSPYINKDDYAETLAELTRIFYNFKTDALDEVDDAEAMALMREIFDGWRGSLDVLEGRMEAAARNVRFGREPEDSGEAPDEEEEVDE